MEPEAYRLAARRVADWTADYLRDVERFPVLTPADPGTVRAGLPPSPPQHGELIEAILADVEELIVPATTHWQSPGFMAYFASSGSGPGILGETIAAAFNVNAMLWRTAPAATELEQVTLDWLRQMVGLPDPVFGVINDTASSSTLYALAAAREAQTDLRIRERGMAGRTTCHPSATTRRRRRTPLSRRPASCWGWAGRGCAGSRWTSDSAWTRSRCVRRSTRTSRPGSGRSRSSPPPVQRRRPASTRYRPSRRSASSTGCGSMSTRHMAVRPRSRRSCAGSSTARTAPTSSWSIHTSGSSHRSTAACCGRGDPRCFVTPSRSCPSTSPRPTARTRSRRTSWTMERRSGGGCGRSSCGWSSGTSAPRASHNAFVSIASMRRSWRAGSRESATSSCLRRHP